MMARKITSRIGVSWSHSLPLYFSPILNLSLNQTQLTFLLYARQTWDDSIDPGNFSVRGYLPLIWKDSMTNMHGLAVYVKEVLPFWRELSLENSADSYLCFWLALLHSVSYFFFLYWSPFSSLCTIFDAISSNIGEVLSINPSANVLLFRAFNVQSEIVSVTHCSGPREMEITLNFFGLIL